MRIACIGGGPAGLYLGVLVKRVAPEHEVVVYERNRAGETFGFGVVFSDATLGTLAAADPETHAQITARFARWDDIAIHAGGEVLRSTGHGFCGIERVVLLQILQARAAELGVRVEYERTATLAECAAAGFDVIVASDGVGSAVRDALAGELQPSVDVRPNKFVWLGSTQPLDAFTFLFTQTPHGVYRVHAYPYRADASTFIVECTTATWRAAGFADAPADEDRTVAALERVFAAQLAGARLVKNRSIWRSFPTVRCARWHAGNTVLVGDAAHTAHFSIGSGTKLAMEDVIVLRDELLAARDPQAALAAYEARRRPEVVALQAAAQASLEWFEGTERYLAMPPAQFAYSLMTRSQRVSHASMEKRDRPLATAAVTELARAAGVSASAHAAPSELPFTLGALRFPSRLCVRGAAGLEVIAAPAEPSGAAVRELLPAQVAAARAAITDGRLLAAEVVDFGEPRIALVGYAAQLARAGAQIIYVRARVDTGERLPGAALSDRIRNELHVPTCIVAAAGAARADIDAAIAAGRCDLVEIATP